MIRSYGSKLLLLSFFFQIGITDLFSNQVTSRDLNYLIPTQSTSNEISMHAELDWLDHNISRFYLPQLCKKENHKLIWGDEVKAAKNAINSSTSYASYVSVIRKLINSLRDFHISTAFYTLEENKYKSIPITFYTVDNRLFVKSVHSSNLQNVNINDEVISLGGEPAMKYFEKAGTDGSLAWQSEKIPNIVAHTLLKRNAERGDELPSGDFVLELRDHKTKAEKSITICWKTSCNCSPKLYNDVTAPSPDLGVLKNYIKAGNFEAKWYQRHQNGSAIGYLQISSFDHSNHCQTMKGFEEIIKRLDQSTDLLVLDLRNNFGGCLDHCLALTSCLTGSNLEMFKVSELLDQMMINSHREELKLYEKWLEKGIPISLGTIEGDDRLNTAHEHGLAPISREYLLEKSNYLSELLKQWSEGKRMSRWQYVFRFLTPNCQARYTKPIVVLVNENSMSAAENMTALLKDNNRALIFGKTTGGAGCGIANNNYQLPMKGPYAISSLIFPTQMALRSNGQMIEDRGIEPDIACDLTIADYLDKGSDYSEKLNKVISQILSFNK